MSKTERVDVAVVGAGLAGVCTAHVLSSLGVRSCLIDRSTHMPEIFRAEKIEADQGALMRDLGLLELREPACRTVGEIVVYDGTHRSSFDTVEQYGIDYSQTVNKLRAHLPADVQQMVKRVARIAAREEEAEVGFDDGAGVRARLVIVATGGNDRIMESMGTERAVDPSLRSLSFGFDLERRDGKPFEFHGFNYHLPPGPHQIDYITIFPIGARIRANLFTQLLPTDASVARLKRDPVSTIDALFPHFSDLVGPWQATSAVQVVPTMYHRLRRPARPGVVVIGEEYQSVSPTTGKGLSRVLTDVKVLCTRYVPRWLAGTPTLREIRAYYADPEKRKVDRLALGTWMHYRNRMLGARPPNRRLRDLLKLHGWTA